MDDWKREMAKLKEKVYNLQKYMAYFQEMSNIRRQTNMLMQELRNVKGRVRK